MTNKPFPGPGKIVMGRLTNGPEEVVIRLDPIPGKPPPVQVTWKELPKYLERHGLEASQVIWGVGATTILIADPIKKE
jgi:hypothetical protein